MMKIVAATFVVAALSTACGGSKAEQKPDEKPAETPPAAAPADAPPPAADAAAPAPAAADAPK